MAAGRCGGPCPNAMTRFRNTPLGRALVGLVLGALVFVAHAHGLFGSVDWAAFDAASSLQPHPRDESAVVVLATPGSDPTPTQRQAALRHVLAAGATVVGLDESFAAGLPAPATDPRCVVAASSPKDPPVTQAVQWAWVERVETSHGVACRVRPPAWPSSGPPTGFIAAVVGKAMAVTPPRLPAGALRANLRSLSSPEGLLIDTSLPRCLVTRVGLPALAAGPPAALRPLVAGRVVLLSAAGEHGSGPASSLASESLASPRDRRALVPYLIAAALAAPAVRELPVELYGCLLVVLAVALMLALGDRGLTGKLTAAATAGAAQAAVWLALLVWGRTFVPLWPGLAIVASAFVVAACLELSETAHLLDREVRLRPATGSAAREETEPSPAEQVESTLRSIIRWHNLPAAALLTGLSGRSAQLAVVTGDGAARWQRAPSLQALARLAVKARGPVLGAWPSGLAEGGQWHVLVVPVTGWAGQTAALLLAGEELPIPHDAVEFGIRAVRQLLTARTLTPEVHLPGSGTRPGDLALPQRVAWLRSARMGRRRQAALAAAWRSGVHEAVVLFDMAGTPVLWNRQAETLFAANDENIGDMHFVPLFARASGLTPKQVRDAATDVVLHGAPFICDLEDPTGRRHFVATLSQVPVGGEAPGGLVVRCIDVTGVCRPARVEARLMSIAAHEMRTPLTSILGYADLLIDSTDRGSTPRRYAAAVHRQAQRLEAVVEELLAVTRLEAGRDELTTEPVDLVALARHVIAAAEPIASDQGLSLAVESDAARAFVRGDALKLERMVENLVTNAVKYSPAGAAVRATVRRSGDRVVVAVADTGPGIPAEDAPHVFEKFYRARTPETYAVPGTGLGLSIVKLIAEAHGGEVTLRTALGAGSTFTVSLPIDGPRRSQASTAA